ncbi:aaa family [Moniliophthora roreri MCA 2997]|uniref:Aaa family n=1 Tax=Moniliophthora roreri (strain MCA 2997) TaxID=1381753 RepID=V2XIF6_MONRO|nr:aaa family [Moniliophthora roreri MCA 2997]
MAESSTEPRADDKSSNADLSKRIARYDQYFDLQTAKPKKLSDRKPVLTVRRLINTKGEYEGTVIDIRSPALCNVLAEINKDVEGLTLTRNPPVANPELFFHSFFGLQERLEREESQASPDQGLINDLKVAIQYVHEDHTDNINNFERLLAHQEITYELLWALFKPNALVYRFHGLTEQVQILLARTVEYRVRPQDKSKYAAIACDIISNDGNNFGHAREILEIDLYLGARRIQDLPVFPLEHHPSKEALREHAIQRGKKFAQMEQHSYHEISGQAMRETMNENFKTYGRVMIDPTAFRLFEPNCTYNYSIHRRLNRSELTDEDYMICTPVLLGFCFGVKMWGGFAMDRLQDIQWSGEAFESLVLGEKQKTLIHALVQQHSARSMTFDDVVKGKGKGLIGLLSGNPGCGKTLTAEAVAEATHRPLYVLSAGELGVKPVDVDKRLTQVLELAQMWNAVLLLDEAEVFLQQRSGTDVMRNALVSIFLKQLEYYQGILILTTNLLEHCDAAFESRIHFSIHYPDLDYDARRKIWNKFFDKAAQGKGHINNNDLDRLAVHSLNGRQIKNAVSSAQCIALSQKAILSVEHIDAVLEVTQDWDIARLKQKKKEGV